MSAAATPVPANDLAEAQRHARMRFAAGVTAAFVLCEAEQWIPSFLAPLFTVALLANLPVRPPLKMSLVLVITMTLSAFFAYALAALFRGTPTVLFGALALTMFLAFHAIASGRPSLPFVLLLICVATIPVIVMIAPAQAEAFPKSMIRGMAVAVLMIGLAYLPWPRAPVPAPAPASEPEEAPPPATAPLVQALLSTAVVMPLMLAYLLLGLADALPVIITTILLVITFDVQRGRQQAMAMFLGNLVGGVLGLVLHTVLLVVPNLWALGGLLFVVLLGFGRRIFSGGPSAPVAVITCNSMLIILSLTIVSGNASLSVWLTRLFQFALAGGFAVGMMSLVLPRISVQTAPPGASA
jgi:hypothetical protein